MRCAGVVFARRDGGMVEAIASRSRGTSGRPPVLLEPAASGVPPPPSTVREQQVSLCGPSGSGTAQCHILDKCGSQARGGPGALARSGPGHLVGQDGGSDVGRGGSAARPGAPCLEEGVAAPAPPARWPVPCGH